MAPVNKFFAQDADTGALPTLYAATEPGLVGGLYIGPDGVGEMRGHPTRVSPSKAARGRDGGPHALGRLRGDDGREGRAGGGRLNRVPCCSADRSRVLGTDTYARLAGMRPQDEDIRVPGPARGSERGARRSHGRHRAGGRALHTDGTAKGVTRVARVDAPLPGRRHRRPRGRRSRGRGSRARSGAPVAAARRARRRTRMKDAARFRGSRRGWRP